MTGCREAIRARVPWPLKMSIKLVLARLPVSYRQWARLGIFRHGAMDDAEYPIDVVRLHLERAGMAIGCPFTALELGPGDSVASALVAAAFGATRTYLVDVGRFAEESAERYRHICEALTDRGHPVPEVWRARTIDEMCERVNASYLTDGLRSLQQLPTASVDIIWSHAVLEHVRAAEFDAIQRELRRVLRVGGVATHRVDLQDHLAQSLNNLRFEDRWWERRLVWDSGFYTNRLRSRDILDSMNAAGFDTELVRVERWPELPVPRERLASRYRAMSVEELSISGIDVVARPR